VAGGTVHLVELVKRFEEVTAVDGIDLAIPGGEFFSLLGAVRLRKDHHAAADRRLRAAHQRPDPAGRPRHGPDPAAPPQGQHRLPELRAVPLPVGARQRRDQPVSR
jgi:spermidine/putrescine transport system ATP-binding protein